MIKGEMYTAAQFLDWVKTVLPDREYTYLDSQNCAFAQFLRAQGHEEYSVGAFYYSIGSISPFGDEYTIPKAIVKPLQRAITFGELARLVELEYAKPEYDPSFY